MNTLIYDYNPDGSRRPVWLLVDIEDPKCICQKKSLYVDVRNPKLEFVGAFDDNFLGCSVTSNELMTGRTDNEFGINLVSLKDRISDQMTNVKRLIIQVCDITEIFAFQGEWC